MIPKRKSRIILSGLLVSILLVSVVAGGFTTQGILQQQSPQISSNSTDLDVGDTGTVEITASELPNGLSGFNFIVRLENPDVATITDAKVSDEFGISEVEVSDDGSEVFLKAADLGRNIQNGSSDVPIATLEVKGEQAGQTGVEFADQNIDSEDGSPADLNLVGGTISVGDETTTTTTTPTTTTTTTTTAPPDDNDDTTTTTTTTAPPDDNDDTTTTTTTTAPPNNGDDNGTTAPPNNGDDNGTTAPPNNGDDNGDDNGTTAPPNNGNSGDDDNKAVDDDCDGLSNQKEMELGTDPNNADTDGDGLTDGEEVNQYGTNPTKTDSDCDGTPDNEEVADS